MNINKKVIVIGGGIGGLSTAALLAKEGLKVTIIEQNTTIGGRARVYKKDGFTFDMGPSWYMMPDVFDKFFALFGHKVADFFNLVRLPVHYKVFFQNGNTYEIGKNLNKNLELFEKNEIDGRKKLKRFLAKSKYLYDSAMKDLVYLDYESIYPLLKPSLLIKLFTLDLFKSFHQSVSSEIKNPDLQKILEFTTVFLGGSPYNTPAFYNLITHTDFNMGIFYPMGGMHKIIDALESLCTENKVEIKLEEKVKKIVVEDGIAKKVITEKDEYEADFIISNADYHFSETQLLEKPWQTYKENYWEKKILSPSAFIIYLGIKGKLKKSSHHNLYFDNSWENHFKSVYSNTNWPDNPSYYFHCPSFTDPSVAPKNSETIMILVPVAAGLKDSEETREKFFKKIVSHFENVVGEKITDRILVKRIFSHKDFTSSYNSYKGSAFGIAHTLFQSAIFRPKNKSSKVKNLYYSGQYTNPGVGVPVCLISAQIVHNAIMNKLAINKK